LTVSSPASLVEVMKYEIAVPYIGGVLSENAYKMPTRGTKWVVKRWMEDLAEKVRELDIPKAESYEIEVLGRFTDERRPDISNLFKVISDAVEGGLGVDDKHFRMVDKGYKTGYLDPELIIAITPVSG